jgi:ferredoxin
MEDVYRKLREKLDRMPIGFPETDEAYEILKIVYSPEDAELALSLPWAATPLEDIARDLGMEMGQLGAQLDEMARKGTVFVAERDGKKKYRMLPSLVGFSETPFWAGKADERAVRLSPLWQRYLANRFARELGDRKQAMMRVIPIDAHVSGDPKITPYERLEELIRPVGFFAVAHCPCRQYARHAGGGCDHSLEVCMHFDGMGRYIVSQGMGRQITREDTLKILRDADEEGLVHITENHQGKIGTICNCCSCCCVFFRTLKIARFPNALQRSNYVSSVDQASCTACGTCADRCPADAIAVDEHAVMDPEKCVGCGVCAPSCPSEAISIVRRPEATVAAIPDLGTWVTNMLKDKGLA